MGSEDRSRFFGSACALLALFLASLIVIRIRLGGPGRYTHLAPAEIIAALGMILSAMAFWILMFVHFLRNTTCRFRVAWGLAFVFANLLAAPAYFLIHVVPRQAHRDT